MTTAQQQFLKDKPLADYWTAIVFSDQFQRVMIHCRAAISEGSAMSAEAMYGVNLLATMLTSICETQQGQTPVVGPGLVHQLDVKRVTLPHKAK